MTLIGDAVPNWRAGHETLDSVEQAIRKKCRTAHEWRKAALATGPNVSARSY